MTKIKKYEKKMKINRIIEFTGTRGLEEPYLPDDTARCFWCHKQMIVFKHVLYDEGLVYGTCEACGKCTLVVFTFQKPSWWFVRRREYAHNVTVYKCDVFPEHLKTINSIHAMAEMQKDEA